MIAKRKNESGLTLIEIIISLAILGIISVSFLTLFTASFSYIFRAGHRSIDHYDSQTYIENIIADADESFGTDNPLDMIFNYGSNTKSVTIPGVEVTDTPNSHLTVFIPEKTAYVGTQVYVTSISVAPNPVTVGVGFTQTLTFSVSPSNSSNKNLSWDTSNHAIATVNGGIVAGHSPGTTSIQISADGANPSGSVQVTIPLTVSNYSTFSSASIGDYFSINGSLYQKIASDIVLRRVNLINVEKWTDSISAAFTFSNSLDPSIVDSSGILTYNQANSLPTSILNNNMNWWTNTEIDTNNAHEVQIDLFGSLNKNNKSGIRPFLTLKPGLYISAGSGTSTNPYNLTASAPTP
jgi:prepilin-type N-terminal cleavage/methylation domain-containing protein